MIGKQVLAFGKSEKSEFINIGIFAASSGGRKGRRHIGKFTPDRERSHVWTGIQEIVGSILQSDNIRPWRLVMKSFLWPFSPYRRFQVGQLSVNTGEKIHVHVCPLNHPRKSMVRLTDRLNMTIVVDWDV